MPVRWLSCAAAVVALAALFLNPRAFAEDDWAAFPEILEQIDVAPVWSVHQIGSPVLLTRDDFQYVGDYDAQRYLTLAQRQLGSDDWRFHRFPIQTRSVG